ncbi:MAG TPA: hypothetical protein VL068_03880 [Microthrixaceae bacterium]|nr:hypothetical protein [Microthrixaceae bacterium]
MRAVLVGGIVVALGAAIGVASREVAEWIGTLGATAALVGVVGLLRVWRIRRRVVRDGWRVRGARFRVADSRWGSNGQPALLLEASDEEPEAILSVSTTVFRWEAFHEADVLWVVGDPRSRFAAVATTDGEHVVVVKRPWSPWWGNRLRKIVTQ